MTATIKDVAKMAGVSISTVSRVINDSKPVSPDARRRVLHAVEVLQYEPNEIARSLVTRKSNIIGVIVDDIGLSYVSEVLRGIEEVSRMYKYDILVSSSYGNPNTQMRYIRLLLQKQVEGIIIVSESYNKDLRSILDTMKVPVSYLNRYFRNDEIATVTINNRLETSKMIKFLLDKGHENIIYLGIEKSFENTVEKFKRAGYEDAMEEAGKTINIVKLIDDSAEAFMDVASQIKEKIAKEKVTAIVAYSDEAAINVINILLDRGIKVPDDVSVVGMGDIKMASLYRPRLTTIKEPLYDYGAVSTRSLIKEINGEGKSEEIIFLPAQIVERESTKQL